MPDSELNPYKDRYGCNASLVRNYDFLKADESLHLFILDIIDKETFEQIKHEAGASFAVPYEGVDITFDGTYEDFKENREKLFRKHQYQRDESRSIESLKSFVPDRALEAWENCIYAHTGRGTTGIKCWEVYSNDQYCQVHFMWIPPPGSGEGVVTSSIVTGGAVVDGIVEDSVKHETDNKSNASKITEGRIFKIGEKFKTSYAKLVTFKRDSNQPLIISVEVNGNVCNLTIDAEASKTTPDNKRFLPYKPTEKFTETGSGDNVIFTFYNTKNQNVTAQVKVTFGIIRLASTDDITNTSVDDLILFRSTSEGDKKIKSSGPQSFYDASRAYVVRAFVNIEAHSTWDFKAHIAAYDRMDVSKTQIRCEIDY